MSKSVAPPSLTLLMCNSGTRSSEVVSALSSIPKFRRSLNLRVMLHRARHPCVDSCKSTGLAPHQCPLNTAGDADRVDGSVPVPPAVSFASHQRLPA